MLNALHTHYKNQWNKAKNDQCYGLINCKRMWHT